MSAFRSNSLTQLPIEQRTEAIQYVSADGSHGETRYPINYEELYNLKGRLLTLIDATFTDQQQRKAHKDVVWQTLQSWMRDIESAAEGRCQPARDRHYFGGGGEDTCDCGAAPAVTTT